MLHHKLPAEPNCSHSTRQSIHSRQLKSNFHSIRLAPDCELGERGRRATFSWPKPHATEAERPCAYDAVRARPLCTDRSAALRPQWLSSARARSPELGAAGGHGSNKGLTGRSVQEGTAVEVQRPSGARAMGYSFIGSYQSASGALPLCDPRASGGSGLFRALFTLFIVFAVCRASSQRGRGAHACIEGLESPYAKRPDLSDPPGLAHTKRRRRGWTVGCAREGGGGLAEESGRT